MLQIIPIALAQGKNLKIYEMKLGKLFILCINQKKINKKVYNTITKSIQL